MTYNEQNCFLLEWVLSLIIFYSKCYVYNYVHIKYYVMINVIIT